MKNLRAFVVLLAVACGREESGLAFRAEARFVVEPSEGLSTDGVVCHPLGTNLQCFDNLLGSAGQVVESRLYVATLSGDTIDVGIFEAELSGPRSFSVSGAPKINPAGDDFSWISRNGTLRVYRDGTMSTIRVDQPDPRDVFLSPNGEIWVSIGPDTEFAVVDSDGRTLRREPDPFFEYVDMRDRTLESQPQQR